MKQLIERAKAQPGQLTHASGGNGSAAHIAFEYLRQRAGLFMLHIPCRGTAPSATDVIGGRVDCTFTAVPAVLQHVPQDFAALIAREIPRWAEVVRVGSVKPS